MDVRAVIPTPHASRYLQQLCKHWSHRLDVTFTPKVGRVPFAEDASCLLEAEDEALKLTISAPDAARAARLEDVVIAHLKRFAFREDLAAPEWRRV